MVGAQQLKEQDQKHRQEIGVLEEFGARQLRDQEIGYRQEMQEMKEDGVKQLVSCILDQYGVKNFSKN